MISLHIFVANDHVTASLPNDVVFYHVPCVCTSYYKLGSGNSDMPGGTKHLDYMDIQVLAVLWVGIHKGFDSTESLHIEQLSRCVSKGF